jgi:hypothetical protein|tara:strand:- start:524 stop:727 length:204 start_codon:yes stop_codon:yes gene_type:complete
MTEVPEELPTLLEIHGKLEDVLEINDVVLSDIAEIKKLLKNLVKLQLSIKDTKDEVLPPLDDDSMFG